MLAVLPYIIVIVAALAVLTGFAIHRMNPDKLRVYGESKLAKFGLEISRSGKTDKPRDDRRELEAGRDRSGPS